MISVKEASDIVLSSCWTPAIEKVNLSAAKGRILSAPIRADREFPPFDRVMMDGIAIRKSDFDAGVRSFSISGLLPAGSPPIQVPEGNYCIEIMTGAVMASNADVVIRYEDVTIENGVATVNIDEVSSKQNIHALGSDRPSGSLLIKEFTQIGAAEIGVLATVGAHEVHVLSRPKVVVVSTGDELVEVNELPQAHQIRKSNVYMLQSICDDYGLDVTLLHLNDEIQEITNQLQEHINDADVLLLSGGVSKGKLDFLPEALESLGIQKRFHRVAQRPGKPFWFGKKEGLTVFAFPGNPVSTYMCAKRYFEPWLRKYLHLPQSVDYAVLDEDFSFKPLLGYFLQCDTRVDSKGVNRAAPVPGQGSGDLANLVDCNSFLELPAERANFKAGEVFPVWKFEN